MIVCKYKFDKSIYSNLIPVFNDGYNGYTVSDEIDGNVVTRTIECDTLPTVMRFGENTGQYEDSKIGAKAKSLKEVLYADISSVIDGGYMFGGCINLTKINTEGWNNNSLTIIHHMFFCCKSLVNLDVTGLVSDMVVNIGFAFYYCAVLYNLTGLESWDISNVTSMNSMFQNCIKLTSLDLSNFDTSKVTRMSSMFQGCSSLTSLDVSNFNTSEVTNMWGMFQNCIKLTSLDVSNFDTSKVTDMGYMFNGCTNLTSLDVSNFNTTNVTSMQNMFRDCENLTSLDVSNWDTSKVTSMQNMFYNCKLLTSLDVSNFDTSKITSMGSMFGVHPNNNSQLKILNINNINVNTSKLPDNDERFMANQLNLEKLYLNDLDTLNIILQFLPDRTEKEAGKLVTSLRNKISEETLVVLTTKNWEIVDLVAQYRYDANTYENLIPEFNAEFSSDMYEIYDSVSEIVIDNMEWEEGAISGGGGENFDVADRVRCKGYYSILPNTTYKCVNHYFNIFWYDESKKLISWVFKDKNSLVISPTNAKYIRVYTDRVVNNCGISAKLITRSIESKNGDLPTLMRFGSGVTVNGVTTDKELALLKVFDINTDELITAKCMFQRCERLSEITNIHIGNKVTDTSFMFENCILLKTIDVSNWDTSNVIDMQFMFNAVNTMAMTLTSLDVSNWDTSNVTNMACIFGDCEFLTTLDVSNWDIRKVTNMGSMFQNCTSLTSLDLSNWNTSEVTNMGEMFINCQSLTSIIFGSNFNTSNVTAMSHMFYGCSNLTSLDVSNFDTKNVTDMSYMFNGCNNLTTLDVSNFNTSNVTGMVNMFANCQSLTSLDVSNWNTSKVINMSNMFNGCNSLTSLDVSNFDTSKVTDIAYMFSGCSILQTVGDLTNWDTKNLEFCHALFYRCFKLKHAHMSGWNTSKVRNVRSMFAGCESIEIIDMHNFDFKNAYNDTGELFKYDMFQLKYLRINDLLPNDYAIDMMPSRTGKEQGVLISDAEISEETLTKLKAKNWTVVSSDTLTKVAEYVYDSKIWNSMIPEFNNEFVEYFIDDVEDENGLVTRTISSMGGLPTLMRFGIKWANANSNIANNNSKSLLEVISMDTSNLTTMLEMFRLNENVKKISCEWDTSKVTNMYAAFTSCVSLTSLNVSNWNTTNVTNMSSMFNNCRALTSLDLSNFDTSKVTNMSYMFDNCNKLTSLDVSNFNTSKLTSTERLSNRWWYPTHSIGMLYCDKDTINKLIPLLKGNGTPTIYVKDVKPNELTPVEGIEFKEYKENSYMINLSSPLLNGDRIEVVNGKLCHYHKMGKVVLDGSENWNHIQSNNSLTYGYIRGNPIEKTGGKIIADKVKPLPPGNTQEGITISNYGGIYFHIDNSKLLTTDANGFRQYLSENPTTVVYELANPYYEDITPLQSDIVLETYLECNMDIYTDLPIKTNVSYITNVPSLSTLSMRATEMKESDNIIANLTNMLDNEINE